MAIDPCLHSFSPQRVELLEEPAISVEFARGPELAHNVVSANGVNEYAPCIAPAQFSVVDQFCQEATARISRISEELKLISLTLLLTQNFGALRIEELWRPYFCVSTNLTESCLMAAPSRASTWTPFAVTEPVDGTR